MFTLAGTMRVRTSVAVLCIAWLSACAPSLTATTNGSAVALPESECPAINLQTPAGAPVQLTGRWRGRNGGTYYVRQSASCVWITGFSVGIGEPGGEGEPGYTNAFFGHLASDLTFSGVWADMPWGREVGVGTVTWQVDIDNIDGVEAMTLSVIEVTNGGGPSLVQPDDMDLTLQVQLQDTQATAGCAIVTSDEGEDYELIVAAPGWELLNPTELISPDGFVTLAGEPFEVSGEVALGAGACGPGQIFIADEIEPAATP